MADESPMRGEGTSRVVELAELGFEPVSLEAAAIGSVRLDREVVMTRATRPAMGTLVSLSVISPSRALAEDGVGRAYEEMDRLIGILSRFESASPVGVLNSQGFLKAPPPEVARLIEDSLSYHRLSRGAFDASVKPLLDLFDDGNGLPAEGAADGPEWKEALGLVGSRHIRLDRGGVRFGRSGMGITLDGIAKGYIVDRMAETLYAAGLRHHLIEAGGDIRASGGGRGRRPWRVAVQDPWKRGRYPAIIELSDAAVATSGSYERYFDQARRYHHVFSALTGRSPRSSASVSVIAPTALAADALATTVFVLGPGKGVPFVDSLPGCSCLVVEPDGALRGSRRWRGTTPNDPLVTEPHERPPGPRPQLVPKHVCSPMPDHGLDPGGRS